MLLTQSHLHSLVFTDSTPVVLHPQQTSLTARLNTDRPTFTSRVKSATFHTNIEKPLHQHKESIMQRPKTAGDVQYYDQLWKPSTQDCRIDDIEDNKTPQQQQQMVCYCLFYVVVVCLSL